MVRLCQVPFIITEKNYKFPEVDLSHPQRTIWNRFYELLSESDQARFSCLRKAPSAVLSTPVYPFRPPAAVPERSQHPMDSLHI